MDCSPAANQLWSRDRPNFTSFSSPFLPVEEEIRDADVLILSSEARFHRPCPMLFGILGLLYFGLLPCPFGFSPLLRFNRVPSIPFVTGISGRKCSRIGIAGLRCRLDPRLTDRRVHAPPSLGVFRRARGRGVGLKPRHG
jgi:hypothetical protein